MRRCVVIDILANLFLLPLLGGAESKMQPKSATVEAREPNQVPPMPNLLPGRIVQSELYNDNTLPGDRRWTGCHHSTLQ